MTGQTNRTTNANRLSTRILCDENQSGGFLVHVTDTVDRPNRGSGVCSQPGQASSTRRERSVIKISHIYIGVIGLSAARSTHHVYGRHNISSTRELNAGYNRASHRRKCARRPRRISSLWKCRSRIASVRTPVEAA
jgi:hypothetical protein